MCNVDKISIYVKFSNSKFNQTDLYYRLQIRRLAKNVVINMS